MARGMVVGEARTCSDCGETKPPSAFNASGRKGYIRRRCKACQSVKWAEWYAAHKSTVAYRDSGRNLRQYGLTRSDYEEMLVAQRGLCAVCGQPETTIDKKRAAVRKLAVDHDHETGQVRGLLCGNCNHGVGKFRDSPRLLRAASEYLERRGLRVVKEAV
jgi:hypothetical protein